MYSRSPLRPTLCAVLAAITFAASTSAQPASAPTSRPTKETILSDIAKYNLPNLTYTAESLARFSGATQKLPVEDRKRIVDTIARFEKLDPEAPELATLLPIRWRFLSTLGLRQDRDLPNPSPFRKRLSYLEAVHINFSYGEDLARRGQGGAGGTFDPSLLEVLNVVYRYPGDPDAAALLRRRLEAEQPGENHDELEKKLLETFPNTPAAKQYLARKYLEENADPLTLPFDLPADKPVVIHFFSPTPAGAAALPTIQALAEKHPDAFALLYIPLGHPTDLKIYCEKHALPCSPPHSADFAATQGITPAETPVTYFLSPTHKLTAIRYDNRLERPLSRILTPTP